MSSFFLTLYITDLPPSRLNGLDPNPWPSSKVECSNALWAIDLVPTDRHEIDLHVVYVEGDLSYCLSRVSVKENFFRAANAPDLFDWLDYADLVVHLKKI